MDNNNQFNNNSANPNPAPSQPPASQPPVSQPLVTQPDPQPASQPQTPPAPAEPVQPVPTPMPTPAPTLAPAPAPQPVPQLTPQPTPEPTLQPAPAAPSNVSPDNPFKNINPINMDEVEPYQPTGPIAAPSAASDVPSPAAPTPASKQNNLVKIVVASVAAAVILGVGIFFLIKNLGPHKKTLAEFKSIMSSLGYTESSTMQYSSSDGSYDTYTNYSDTSVGLAVFYEMPSKDALKTMVEQELASSSEYINSQYNFDWSKDQNKATTCTDAEPYACFAISQIDNTALLVIATGNSTDEARSETDKIVSAMGY